jgi:hypothetical protein
VVVGCFVLLYRNKVYLVLGWFYLFISFVLMLFDVKSTNHVIFPPKKKSGFATPLKITMNLSKVLSKYIFHYCHRTWTIPYSKVMENGFGFWVVLFSFLLSNNTQGTQGEEYVQFLMNKHAKTIRLQCKFCHKYKEQLFMA